MKILSSYSKLCVRSMTIIYLQAHAKTFYDSLIIVSLLLNALGDIWTMAYKVYWTTQENHKKPWIHE